MGINSHPVPGTHGTCFATATKHKCCHSTGNQRAASLVTSACWCIQLNTQPPAALRIYSRHAATLPHLMCQSCTAAARSKSLKIPRGLQHLLDASNAPPTPPKQAPAASPSVAAAAAAVLLTTPQPAARPQSKLQIPDIDEAQINSLLQDLSDDLNTQQQQHAARELGNLAMQGPQHQQAIAAAGAVQLLLAQVVNSSSSQLQGHAALALASLRCTTLPRSRQQLQAAQYHPWYRCLHTAPAKRFGAVQH